jgi:hypothetical protein
MYQVTAALFMPLPIMEIRLAVNTNRIPRCRQISRMNNFSADSQPALKGAQL